MSRRTVFTGIEISQAIDGRALTDAEILDGDRAVRQLPDQLSTNNSQLGEAALWLVLTERDAKKIVTALENGHAYEVIAILKNQPWWPELSAAVRKLAHRPVAAVCDRRL